MHIDKYDSQTISFIFLKILTKEIIKIKMPIETHAIFIQILLQLL